MINKVVTDIHMRDFIRHPTDIPIELIPVDSTLDVAPDMESGITIERMENISFGGLMFQSAVPYTQNQKMLVKINSIAPSFEAYATVSWCRKSGRFYLVGLEFTDEDSEFKIRMVEQVCHIVHYKKKVLETEGRELGDEEAAEEWIKHFADKFPK